jgi:hypothetical protein
LKQVRVEYPDAYVKRRRSIMGAFTSCDAHPLILLGRRRAGAIGGAFMTVSSPQYALRVGVPPRAAPGRVISRRPKLVSSACLEERSDMKAT